MVVNRHAIQNPVGSTPIHERVKSWSRVAIGFADRVKRGEHATARRKVAIPILLEELTFAGVVDDNVTLVFGVQRNTTAEEFMCWLVPDLVRRFSPERFANHDAEDPAATVRRPRGCAPTSARCRPGRPSATRTSGT